MNSQHIPSLSASRDPVTGETYIPPRELAADGSLRVCEPLEVPMQGTLFSWTEFRGNCYGIVDLTCGARIQTLLDAGPHEIGAPYSAKADGNEISSRHLRFSHD